MTREGGVAIIRKEALLRTIVPPVSFHDHDVRRCRRQLVPECVLILKYWAKYNV